MDQFEYVMVLVSIIVGLGIAHILLGIGGIIDRLSHKENPLELSLAHASWLGFCFSWLVMFWWWEYRFSSRVSDWTMGLYLFLITYAVTLFLLQAVLVPRTWDGVKSLKDFFLERRAWFYGLLMFATILDLLDSYLKGGFEYILDTGIINMGFAASTIPIVIIGVTTTKMRFHNFVGLVFFGWQLLLGFGNINVLAS
ncbi:MAG: hypothetical protein ACYSOH_00385 [Planctomycetota bacterium]|jgi:hypothetical protein